MAFPKTDAFTGTNGTVLTTYNASYLNVTGAHAIQSNAAYANNLGGSGENCTVWNGDTANADQKSFGTIASNGSRDIGVSVRGNTTGSVTYIGWYAHGGSYGVRELFKQVSGARTSLGTTALPWVNLDVVYVDIVGTSPGVVSAKCNSVLAAFGTKNESSIPSGQPGICSTGQNASSSLIDDVTFDNLGSAGQSLTGSFSAPDQIDNLAALTKTFGVTGATVATDEKSSAGAVAPGALALAGAAAKTDEQTSPGAVAASKAVAGAFAATDEMAFPGGDWRQLSPSVSLLSPGTGTRAARGYGCLAFDSVRGRVYNHIGYIDGTGRRDSIYSNQVEYLDYAGNTIHQEKLSNWNNPAGNLTETDQLTADDADPTPPNRHPYYAYLNGKLWHFSGLNSVIHCDRAFAPTDVNTTTFEITLAASTPFTNGDEVRVISTLGLPSPLAPATSYWLIRVGATKIKLADTYANAMAGTAKSLSTQGTGTHTLTRVDGNHPSDVWAYDIVSKTWTQFFPNPGYSGEGIAYTAAVSANWYLNKLLITNLGGHLSSGGAEASYLYDVAGGTLTALSGTVGGATSPSVQSANCMAFDPVRGKTWMFGGGNFSAGGAELWAFDWSNNTWATVAQSATKPAARLYHAVLYNSKYDCLMVFGGAAGDAGAHLRDLWIGTNLDGTISWTQISTSTLPTSSKFAYGAYDSINDQAILWNDSNEYWAYRYIGDSPTPGGILAESQPIAGSQSKTDDITSLAAVTVGAVAVAGAAVKTDEAAQAGTVQPAALPLAGVRAVTDEAAAAGAVVVGAETLQGSSALTDEAAGLGAVAVGAVALAGALSRTDESVSTAVVDFRTLLTGSTSTTDESANHGSFALGTVVLLGSYSNTDERSLLAILTNGQVSIVIPNYNLSTPIYNSKTLSTPI